MRTMKVNCKLYSICLCLLLLIVSSCKEVKQKEPVKDTPVQKQNSNLFSSLWINGRVVTCRL